MRFTKYAFIVPLSALAAAPVLAAVNVSATATVNGLYKTITASGSTSASINLDSYSGASGDVTNGTLAVFGSYDAKNPYYCKQDCSSSGFGNATADAQFLYVVAGATSDTVTPITFDLTLTAPNQPVAHDRDVPHYSSKGSIKIIDRGVVVLNDSVNIKDKTLSFTYNALGAGGYLEIVTSLDASVFYSLYRPQTISASTKLEVKAPTTVGYLFTDMPAPSVPAAVPEPASWAMMLGGFGLVGITLRSRRKAVATFG